MEILADRRRQERQAQWDGIKRGRSVADAAESGKAGGEIEEKEEIEGKEHGHKRKRRS